MCWDFVKDHKFLLDLQRPIYSKDLKSKQKIVVLKYIDTCYSINCPLMTMYKGYTYKFRMNIFFFFIKQILFIALFKMPFSQIFPNVHSDIYDEIM